MDEASVTKDETKDKEGGDSEQKVKAIEQKDGALKPIDEKSQQTDEAFGTHSSSIEQKDEALQPMDGELECIDEAFVCTPSSSEQIGCSGLFS